MKLYRTHKDRIVADDELMARARETYAELEEHLYEGVTGWVQRRGHKKVHSIVDSLGLKQADKRILEIGIGYGHHLQFGSAYDSDYTGIDVREDAISHVKRHHPNVNALVASAEDLPLENDSFDAVLSIYNLEHMPDLEAVLVEVERVLKKSGVFIVAVPSEGGFLYNVGRELTSKRYYSKTFGLDYDAIIKREHCNEIWDVERKIRKYFNVNVVYGVPFFISWYHLSPVMAYVCVKR